MSSYYVCHSLVKEREINPYCSSRLNGYAAAEGSVIKKKMTGVEERKRNKRE